MSKTNLKLLFVLTVIFLLPLKSFAQGGPPLITDDPETPGDGNWEINIAGQGTISQFEDIIQAPYFDINYGLGDRIQLKLEGGLESFNDAEETKLGGTTAEFGIKWRFVDLEKAKFAISMYPQVTFDYFLTSKDTDLTEPGTQLFLPLEFAKHWGGFAINPEVGYQIASLASDQFVYGIVFAYKFPGDYELLSELHNRTRIDEGDSEFLFNIGTRIPLSKSINLMGSAGYTLETFTDDQKQFLFYLGLQFHFGEDKEDPVPKPKHIQKRI